ncbi:MAG: L-aspartate oxidase [Ruminococcaceae bacterium]|nr:L-aspartate oxidase [Oscillospiraceae bacterium]
MNTDILIIGCGVSGLYCALNFPENKKITIITKSSMEDSNSYLAQGGICVMNGDDDYRSFYDDTMKAGHYENNPDSVDIMIKSSRGVISDLVSFGVDFNKNGDDFAYTREGAHSSPRILFHEDTTGKEITSTLIKTVKNRKNITIIEHFTMVDILCENNICHGIIGLDKNGKFDVITANYTVFATGGIGGLFEHSTNFRHLTGDSLAIAHKHGISLQNIDYIQIHPTTLYSKKEGRKFLISESVRGEGAILLNSKGERFVNELLPRDVVAKAIFEEMNEEGTQYVYLSLAPIPKEEILNHFPNIYQHCLEEGYDITKEPIPVVPSQHYFMGGIAVDSFSKTAMNHLYAVGETACNGVHGKNRLASNSLLESLVFAKRAASHINMEYTPLNHINNSELNTHQYDNFQKEYKEIILNLIEKERNSHE